MDALDLDPDRFLWPQERMLVVNLLMGQQEAFAWDESKRGTFDQKYFDPIWILTIEHEP